MNWGGVNAISAVVGKVISHSPSVLNLKYYSELSRLMDQVQKQVSTPELVSAMWDEVAPPIIGSHLQAIGEEEEQQLAEQYPKQLQEEIVEADQPPVNATVTCPEVVGEQKSLHKQSEKEETDERSHILEGMVLAVSKPVH